MSTGTLSPQDADAIIAGSSGHGDTIAAMADLDGDGRDEVITNTRGSWSGLMVFDDPERVMSGPSSCTTVRCRACTAPPTMAVPCSEAPPAATWAAGWTSPMSAATAALISSVVRTVPTPPV